MKREPIPRDLTWPQVMAKLGPTKAERPVPTRAARIVEAAEAWHRVRTDPGAVRAREIETEQALERAVEA